MDSQQRSFLSSYDGFESETKRGPLTFQGKQSDFGRYNRALISDVKILVDTDEIKATAAEVDTLGDRFESILRQEFDKKFTLTQNKGAGTLEVRAALVDVKPNSPAWFVAGYAPGVLAATSAVWAATGDNPGSGVTTIQVEVLDSVTKERLYAFIDQEKGGKHKVRGGLTRWGQAEISFQKWAAQIAEAVSR